MSIDLMGFFLKKLERLAVMLKVAEFEEKKYIITGFWLGLLICFGNEPIGGCSWGRGSISRFDSFKGGCSMRIRRLWLAPAFLICLGGCISSGEITAKLDSWKGKSKQVVEQSWGKAEQVNVNSFVYIAEDEGVFSASINYLDSNARETLQTHDGVCRIVFTFGSNNKVQQSTWSGSKGRCYQYAMEHN